MAWARSGRGGVGVDLFVPPAVVSNIKVETGNSVVKFRWTDPDDITAEGIVVNEWEGTVIVVNKEHKPTDQNDGDVIYTSKVKNQHQEEPYTAEELDVKQTYYYGIFPYSKYKVFNTNQSQTGEFTVVSAPELKPLSEYTWDEIKEIANMGDKSSDGNHWQIDGQNYFTLGDKTAPQNFGTLGIYELMIAGFLHDVDATNGGKVPITFIGNKATSTNAYFQYNTSNTASGGFGNSLLKKTLNQGTIFSKIPQNIKNVATLLRKKYDDGNNQMDNVKIVEVELKFFALTYVELFGKTDYAIAGQGSKYPIFTSDASRIRLPADNQDTGMYWTSSTVYNSRDGEHSGLYINAVPCTTGKADMTYASDYKTVVFGFGVGEGRV